jgi:hypothetical protein
MNVQFRDRAEPASPAAVENGDRRLRYSSGARDQNRIVSVSGEALA